MTQTLTGSLLLLAAGLLPAISRASPLPEAAAAEAEVAAAQGAAGDTLLGPPPMWNIRCPRDLQDYCTPDNKLFYCTVNGELWNQLHASCGKCVCRDASGGRPRVG